MLIRLAIMIVATFFDLFIIIGIIRSNNYQHITDYMDGTLLKQFYGIGFYLSDSKMCFFKEAFLRKLRAKTVLIYGEKYADYYAVTAFAKVLTFISLFIGVFSSIGVMMGKSASVFMFILGLVCSAISWNFFILTISDETKNRTSICMTEFPDMVIKFALLINSGMILRDAWNLIAYSKNNVLYTLMQESCEDMHNGVSEIDAIYEFGVKTNCVEIRKFAASMIQGVSKGNSELSVFLSEQAQEMLEHKRQMLLQKGEKAAGKLLIPIGMSFLGIILIIGVGAMQSMSF